MTDHTTRLGVNRTRHSPVYFKFLKSRVVRLPPRLYSTSMNITKMHSTWRTHSDVMDDIWALSEMEGIGSREIEEPPPPTILEYRAQIAANNTGSVYDNPELGGQNVVYTMSGRGRGSFNMLQRSGPGVSQFTDNLVTEEVQRRLRQVAGPGYSNALIEQGVKAITGAAENKVPTASHTASPSKTSASYKTSGLFSPMNETSPSSSSSVTSTSPHLEPVKKPSPPPPLSIMRKKAQEERAKSKQNATEETSAAKTETSPSKKTWKDARNGTRSPWQSPSPSTSSDEGSWRRRDDNADNSDEGSWRRRDGNTANRFFKPRPNGFHLTFEDFPVLK